jgi:hypothetical protein
MGGFRFRARSQEFLAPDRLFAEAPLYAPVHVPPNPRFRCSVCSPPAGGRPVKVNGVTHTVIGVMPAGFRFPEFAQLWIPLARASST